MNINKSLMLFGILGLSVAFGADINEITNIAKDADTAGKSTLGVGMSWFFSVFFPVACVLGAMVLGYFIAKTKIDQTKEGVGKLFLSVIASALVGGFVYFLVTASVSQMILGDRGKLFTAIQQFWSAVLGV